jgi:hypothetical protein
MPKLAHSPLCVEPYIVVTAGKFFIMKKSCGEKLIRIAKPMLISKGMIAVRTQAGDFACWGAVP